LCLLDRYYQPVPRGAVGEVFVGGPGLARGYHNAPALTARRFLPDPFGEPGERIYGTGDLGRIRADGALELLGRADHQVKVRGYRIELGEIEATLTRHPAIVESVVAAFGAESHANRRLIAFFVARQRLGHDELRAFLRQRLPEYMVPNTFVQVQALPRTATRKVDRRALRPPATLGEARSTYSAPRTALQHTVAATWQEILNLERVGVNENFFDLGGNSLLAVRVRARLQEQLEIELPLIDLFRYPTVATLATHIASCDGANQNHLRARVRDDRYVVTRHARRDARKTHRATTETRRGY
jgi:acyl carrier protein